MEEAMARKKSPAILRDDQTELARARLERFGRNLAADAEQPGLLDETREERRWMASGIEAFLAGKEKSLNHALGLVRRQGNPGKLKVWADRAADLDSKNLSHKAAADLLGLNNERSLRRSRSRGRAANEPARISACISLKLDAAAEEGQAKRIAEVELYNREHGIRSSK
jgi:hypothetical protein